MDSEIRAALEALVIVGGGVPKKSNEFEGRRFLDRKQAADYIGMSDFWLDRHANSDEAPRFIKHGRKAWYLRSELDAWLAKRSISTRAPQVGDADPRRFVEPAEATLERLWEEAWGEDSAKAEQNFERVCSRLLDSLTTEQRAMLAQIARGLQDKAK